MKKKKETRSKEQNQHGYEKGATIEKTERRGRRTLSERENLGMRFTRNQGLELRTMVNVHPYDPTCSSGGALSIGSTVRGEGDKGGFFFTEKEGGGNTKPHICRREKKSKEKKNNKRRREEKGATSC